MPWVSGTEADERTGANQAAECLAVRLALAHAAGVRDFRAEVFALGRRSKTSRRYSSRSPWAGWRSHKGCCRSPAGRRPRSGSTTPTGSKCNPWPGPTGSWAARVGARLPSPRAGARGWVGFATRARRRAVSGRRAVRAGVSRRRKACRSGPRATPPTGLRPRLQESRVTERFKTSHRFAIQNQPP